MFLSHVVDFGHQKESLQRICLTSLCGVMSNRFMFNGLKEKQVNQQKPHAAMQRLPYDLAQWLKHKAVDNHRSLNAEILHRLEQSRKAEEAPHEKQA